MPRIIEIIVTPTGEVRVETKGFVGGDCLQASKDIETALGVRVSEQKTSEFYTSTSQQQELHQ